MAHPIVIMAYEKSPAITKAVAALEEAGMEVIVLNTATAKLVNFLGALAGEDMDEDEDAGESAPEETPPEEGSEEEVKPKVKPTAKAGLRPEEMPEGGMPPEEEEGEPLATEAIVNGEKVIIEIVSDEISTLHANHITTGAKTFYKLNESTFSFWPSAVSNEPITGAVQLELDNEKHMVKVIFSEEAKTPAVLKLSRKWLKEARYPHDSWSVLPATSAIFGKGKVTPDEVDKELSHGSTKGTVMIVMNDKNKLIMMPGDHMGEAGTVSKAHHDQTWRSYGNFKIVGYLKKDGGAWKFEGQKTPGLETPEQIAKFKAPVFVFK